MTDSVKKKIYIYIYQERENGNLIFTSLPPVILKMKEHMFFCKIDR